MKKKSIGLFFCLFFCLFSAGVWLFDDIILSSYVEKAVFEAKDISVVGYSRNRDCFIPNADENKLEIFLDDELIDMVRIDFSQSIEETMSIDIYYKDYYQNDIFVRSEILKKGSDWAEIKFENIQTNSLSFCLYSEGNSGFYLEKISVQDKQFNPLQQNVFWIGSVLGILVISGALALYVIKSSKLKAEPNQTKVRESNVELLRIICMFLIIAHHCVVHGGVLGSDYSFNKIFSVFWIPGGKICFDAFLAISTWFLVDKEFSVKRFIKTWGQVFIYSVVFTFVAYLMGKDISIIEFFSSFLPIAGNSHGFAASYLAFYLLLPFISNALKGLNKLQARILLMIVGYLQVVSQIIGTITEYKQPLASEVTLFVLCYIISFNLKKWPIKILDNVKFDLAVLLSVFCFQIQQTFQTYGNGWLSNSKLVEWITKTCMENESGLLIIVAGYMLFFVFKNIRIKHNKIINLLASCTFGVLLIHDHNFFRSVLWQKIAVTHSWYYESYYVPFFVYTVISVFVVCAVIEYLRQRIIEKNFMKSSIVKNIENKCENLFSINRVIDNE